MNNTSLGSRAGLLILAAGVLVLFIGGGARFAPSVTLREMAQEFDMGRGMPSLIVGVYQVVMAVAMLVAGRMIDRTDARYVLAAGLVIAAAGIGLVGMATASWQALILFGIVFAIGNGIASITPVTVIVTRWFPLRAGFANSIVVAGMSIGQLAMVAAMAAILVAAGWRSVYIWTGLAHLLLLPLVFAMPREAPPAATPGGMAAAPQRSGLTLGEAVRTRAFWLLMGAYAMCGFDDFFVSTHVVAFAQDRGIDRLFAGNLLGLMGLTALAGVFWAGAWSDRSGPYAPMIACFGLRLAAHALIVVDQSELSVTIFSLMFGITFLMTAPLTAIIVRNAFGNVNIGTIAGLIMMIHHMTGGIGALLGGVVFDRVGNYDIAFWVMLVSTALAVWASHELWRRPKAV